MEYFFDTEFVEDGVQIELLSIGIVAADGREYYAQNFEARLDLANDWVKLNVIPKMTRLDLVAPGHPNWSAEWLHADTPWRTRAEIRAEIMTFCDPAQFGRPSFWASFCSYDWVVLCQIFGRMIDLPKGYPMYCQDLKQYSEDLKRRFKLERAPRCSVSQGPDEHHALADARWDRTYYLELAALDARLSSGVPT